MYPALKRLYDSDFNFYVYLFALFAIYSTGLSTLGIIRTSFRPLSIQACRATPWV